MRHPGESKPGVLTRGTPHPGRDLSLFAFDTKGQRHTPGAYRFPTKPKLNEHPNKTTGGEGAVQRRKARRGDYAAGWPRNHAPPFLFFGLWRRFQFFFWLLVIFPHWAGLGIHVLENTYIRIPREALVGKKAGASNDSSASAKLPGGRQRST